MEIRKKIGFFLGPLFFLISYFSPLLPQNPKAHYIFSIFLFVITWWVSECIPIPITALLIPVLITVFQIAPAKEAFAPFADPVIMLFMGGFILARGMSFHSLDLKLAHSILSLKVVASKKSRIILSFAFTTSFISMWISNTATTAMMFPIALGVLGSSLNKASEKGKDSFTTFLMLTIAYSSSIGGIGTPIGSPPNLIAIGMLSRLTGYKINFFQWMVIGFLVIVPMHIFLFLLMKIKLGNSNPQISLPSFPERECGGLNRGQKNVLLAFLITVFLWVSPGIISLFLGREHSFYLWLERHFPESVVALIGASLLFLLPVNLKKGEFTLHVKEAMKIDWGTLILFGGGLSLGLQIFESGLAEEIGRFIISSAGNKESLLAITFFSVTFCVFLTEVASNTASANIAIPIIIALSKAASINPVVPVFASALGCSFAFMLPVSTPPNAIVYGSGYIPIQKMIKIGFILEIVGIVLICLGVGVIAPMIGLI